MSKRSQRIKLTKNISSKGLTRYMSCGIHELRFPLMALIDYRGFRLTAQSILPIKDNTLGTFVLFCPYITFTFCLTKLLTS